MKTYSNDKFVKTSKKVRITFGGWDGKSYNGEGRNMVVYKHPNMPDKEFVRGHFGGARCYRLVADKWHPRSGERAVVLFANVGPDEEWD